MLDHELSNGINAQDCLLTRLKQQAKQSLDSSYTFHAGAASVCAGLPAPAPFSSPSITVCLHYLRSRMDHGSGLSLGSCGGPTLPCPALPHTPPHHPPPTASPNNKPSPACRGTPTNALSAHTSARSKWKSVFLLPPYLGQIPRPLRVHHSNAEALSAVLSQT